MKSNITIDVRLDLSTLREQLQDLLEMVDHLQPEHNPNCEYEVNGKCFDRNDRELTTKGGAWD